MKEYNHKKIESKWQKEWSDSGIYRSEEGSKKPKYYLLDMFPYPSGSGLHVGHPKGYIASDVLSRFKRMNGFNVLHPMGWDAFGLPAENYALENKVHPRIAVEENVKRFKEQLNIIGFDFDWEREVNTTDPEYYRWTQWTFIQMYKKGLAYESNEPINWCPSCKTGLANEDLEGGNCERCGTLVEQKPIRQWVLNIRKYADRLLEDLEDLDWPNSIKESQKNWIGRSEGTEVEFEIKLKNGETEKVDIFTTRIDTLFGCTYLALAPEHPLVKKLSEDGENLKAVDEYVKAAKKKDAFERMAEDKEKTGIEIEGVKAINPATKQEIPVFVTDYVLISVGTGAIMSVPAHDERDLAFATKFNIPVITVISNKEDGVYTGEGVMMNSGKFDGIPSQKAKEKIRKYVNGKKTVNYKLRDWVFSRQRYWGEPIPMIHCEKCGVVPVPEKELPVVLPEVESYEPTGTGESPLANIDEWVNVKCPKCNGYAKRETNTMPQWAGSSWYYLRYIDPKNSNNLVDKKKEKYWSPVDMYIGGAEHATRHLIYARFWHKFLNDIKVVKYSEPFKKLQSVGLINAEDGKKMSKRYGNVVNPDEIVGTYGADTFRLYEMFMGPFDQAVAWKTESVIGPRRFVEKVWRLQEKVVKTIEDTGEEKKDISVTKLLHQTIKKVTEDIETLNFNTAVSAMMVLVNKMEEVNKISKQDFETILKLLSPFAPHMTEEIWRINHESSIHVESWPEHDSNLAKETGKTLGVQINGKVRAEIEIMNGTSEDEVKERVLSLPEIQKRADGKEIKKFIYIEGKIISIVISG